ncbi:hypothetical protein P7C70_g1068, partial [Phenoliferia sp. Uapishka_3]
MPKAYRDTRPYPGSTLVPSPGDLITLSPQAAQLVEYVLDQRTSCSLVPTPVPPRSEEDKLAAWAASIGGQWVEARVSELKEDEPIEEKLEKLEASPPTTTFETNTPESLPSTSSGPYGAGGIISHSPYQGPTTSTPVAAEVHNAFPLYEGNYDAVMSSYDPPSTSTAPPAPPLSQHRPSLYHHSLPSQQYHKLSPTSTTRQPQPLPPLHPRYQTLHRPSPFSYNLDTGKKRAYPPEYPPSISPASAAQFQEDTTWSGFDEGLLAMFGKAPALMSGPSAALDQVPKVEHVDDTIGDYEGFQKWDDADEVLRFLGVSGPSRPSSPQQTYNTFDVDLLGRWTSRGNVEGDYAWAETLK